MPSLSNLSSMATAPTPEAAIASSARRMGDEDPPKRAPPLPARLRNILGLLAPRERRRRSILPTRGMTSFAAERASLVSSLRSVRWVSVVLGIGNLGVLAFGGYLMVSLPPGCWGEAKLPSAVVVVVALVRIMSMFGAALAQMETAATIANGMEERSDAVDAMVRHERRARYKRWLWWTRFGMAITMLQFVGALYLTIIIWRDLSYGINSRECFAVQETESRASKEHLAVFFLILVWTVVIIQCFSGSDVLRWRSFYTTHDTAWKAHYQEVFDHGIREALCCLGRAKYLSVLEEDEVYSVARLLGDLVAYRASGTGHLELLAGLALLQKHREMPKLYDEPVEAPEALIREAAILHQFAEAAYTGPLLDFGRNPILFPCAWLYRQGILTPWTRNRRPVLEGDNWWRGHAAAFLKYVNLSPDVLRRGRVSQIKREAAYFVVVLHHVKTVVIAVRGTETPEDLITDGLCRECALSVHDLDGLINSDRLSPDVRQRVLSSFPHYGHSGIVESARELFMQLDGEPCNKEEFPSENTGFLSSLLGPGCECQGYKIRIVGHSLGGAVGAVLGLRLSGRYPDLHVYSYGTPPCVDKVVAEACSDFVTSLVYNDEFSSRLSVNSIIRLRAAAMTALSNNSSSDSAMIYKLARRILHINKPEESRENDNIPALSCQSADIVVENGNQRCRRKHVKYTVKGGVFLCSHAFSCMLNMPSQYPCKTLKDDAPELSSGIRVDSNDIYDKRGSGLTAGSGGHEGFPYREVTSLIDGNCAEVSEDDVINFNNGDVSKQADATNTNDMVCFDGSDGLISFEDHSSVDTTTSSIQASIVETPEMFLPGLIIYVVPEQKSTLPLWNSWRIQDGKHGYRAFLANRESFKDIVITPYMFLDHLPWRCHYAMQRVLETRRAEGRINADCLNAEHII